MTFQEAIHQSLGFSPNHVAPGKMVRFSTSDRKGDKSGWARLFDDGEGGVFGCWRSDVTEVWQAKQPSTEAERQAWKDQIAEAKKKAQAEIEKQRADCRSESLELWEKARDVGSEHVYLVAKDKKRGQQEKGSSLLLTYVEQEKGSSLLLTYVETNIELFISRNESGITTAGIQGIYLGQVG